MTVLTDKIKINKSNGVGWITLNQPQKKNAISFEMWEAIPHIAQRFSDDDDIRVVVVKGEGDQAFSSGADISQFENKRSSKSTTDEYNLTVKAAVAALDQLAKPLIARVLYWWRYECRCPLRYSNRRGQCGVCYPRGQARVGLPVGRYISAGSADWPLLHARAFIYGQSV